MAERDASQTTLRERVPCGDVAILAAYEAGRRDALDEAIAIVDSVATTDGSAAVEAMRRMRKLKEAADVR